MEPAQPEFSIIIPVYNGENTLPDTFRSIQNLEGSSYEFIVVDDASTDRTTQMAKEAGAKVISLKQNNGPATARNIGAKEAQGTYLLFTDSDVLLPKTLLIDLKYTFDRVQADAVQGTFSEVTPFANYFSQYKNLYNRWVLSQLPEWIDTTFTSVTAVRKEAFLQSGGFDENIKEASVEDRTLGRNLIAAGYKIYMDKKIEVIHNKNLSAIGFFRNQFRRSRDLMKLMLRNRKAPLPQKEEEKPANNDSRFGTNLLSTMMRIPIAYLIFLFAALSFQIPIFVAFVIFFGIMFLHLIIKFEFFLIKAKGFDFALKGLPVNFADALISGFGILTGAFEYFLLGKRY